MKIRKHRLQSYNIFHYIIFFTVIVILITCVLGGYLYLTLRRTVYSDFWAGNEQYLEAIVNRHENDMQIVDDIVTQMQLLEEITRFRLREKPQNAEIIMQNLKGYTTVSQFFDLLFYQYHEDDFLYHHLSSISKLLFIRYGSTFSEMTGEEFMEVVMEKDNGLRILPEQTVEGKWIGSYLSDTRNVIILRAIPPMLEGSLIFMVPGNYYDELLAGENEDRRRDFLWYDGQLIVSRGCFDFPENFVEKCFSQEKMEDRNVEGETLQCIVSDDTEEYLFSVRKGASGIYYGTLQSMEVYYDKMVTEQWLSLVLIVACALLAMMIIIFGSKGFVKKVRYLNELLNEDSYYDLSRIENGIQTLINTYHASEKEGLIFKKTQFIRNFIRGDFANRETALQAAEKLKMNIDYSCYVTVLLKNREISQENKAYSSMLKVIERETKLEGYGVHLINNNQNLFVLYSDSKDSVEKVLQNMLAIGQEYSREFVIAVSDYHTDFTEGAKAYLEAVTAFDNYLLMGNSRIIRFSEVAQREYVSLLPEIYSQQLKYAIRTRDKGAVELVVKDICSKLKEDNVSLYAFRIFYNDIIHILLSEWKGSQEKFNHFYNVFILSQCLSIQEFGELLCEICSVIIDSDSRKQVAVSDVVEEAIAYMRENFHDSELTMNSVAEHLGISAVTLSVEFKNEMNIRPSDYLGNLRIEKAKELLSSTEMLIRDIRQAVGYEDDRVFMRRFKNHTGMTPGQYRAK